MNLSGFSFVHNALTGGYPIVQAINAVAPFVDEMVVVDAESTDGTRDILVRMGCRVIDAKWGTQDEKTLTQLHALNTECKNDGIVHFEADEIFDHKLLENMIKLYKLNGPKDIGCWRLQVEQNFQRIREYPVPVHRIFDKGTVVKDGRTTLQHGRAYIMPPEHGFLWDVTNCFRDNWLSRIKQNAQLWHEEIMYRMAPAHAFCGHQIKADEVDAFLSEPHWWWHRTPLDIPPILRPLVGKTKYEVYL